MIQRFVFCCCMAAACMVSNAQDSLPILRANSPKVAIRDGDEPLTRYWNHLSPDGAQPVVYRLLKSPATRKVVFFTDMDSTAFEVAPGKTYDFLVLMNQGKDTCRAQLSTIVPPSKSTGASIGPDIIPFTLDASGNIELKGKINGKGNVKFIFDSGASHTYVVGDGFDKKLNIQTDGFIEDESITGLAREQTSSDNSLEINGLRWERFPLIYVDVPGYNEESVLVGYNAFEDKVVEIDYEGQRLLVHSKMPSDREGYTPVGMRHTSGGTYLEVTLDNGRKEYTGWFLFDTGATGSNLTASGDFVLKNELAGTMKKIGEAGLVSTEAAVVNVDIVLLPRLKIGGYELAKVPILLTPTDNSQMQLSGGLGNGLLRRFNMMIDYPNAKAYLKPNKAFGRSFQKKKRGRKNG